MIPLSKIVERIQRGKPRASGDDPGMVAAWQGISE